MRSAVPQFELRPAQSLAEALALISAEPGVWRPFAGGTDLMVLLEAGKLAHRRWVSIWGLPELKGIAETPADVTLGALTTYAEVLAHPTLRREFPMLCQAAAETGAVAIQNRGTLGGNIANASPAADSPPALLCYDAELELASAKGTRRVPYAGFHTGYKQSVLQPGELIARIRLPRPSAGAGSRIELFRKVGTRKAQAISKVCFAGLARLDAGGRIAGARIALGSVAPIPIRCTRTEAAIEGRAPGAAETVAAARAELAREIAPIDDIRSTAAYRLRVAQNLAAELLRRLAGG